MGVIRTGDRSVVADNRPALAGERILITNACGSQTIYKDGDVFLVDFREDTYEGVYIRLEDKKDHYLRIDDYEYKVLLGEG